MDLKIAVKTGVVAALSWFVGGILTHAGGRPSSLLSGLWCVVAAIVVVQEHLGGTYKVALSRFIGIAIGSVLGGIFTEFLGATPISLGIAVVITIILCSLFDLTDSFRIASLSVAVVMVSWEFKPQISPWAFSFYRFLDSVIGIIIAIVVVHLLWPIQATQTMRQNVAKTLSKLNLLYRLATTIDGEKSETNSDYRALVDEIEKLLLQNQAFFEEAKMELLTKAANVELWAFLLEHLQGLLESINALRIVYSKSVYEIFDQDLLHQIDDLINQTIEAFQRLANMLITSTTSSEFVDLSTSLEKLKQELIRFRTDRPTRQFPWPDVQNFFVFFYSLKVIAEELKRMEKRVNRLND